MQVISRELGDVHEVRLDGVLDALAATQVREDLAALIESGARTLVLDMTDVERVDSSGLGALITAFKAIRECEGEMLLASLSPSVRTVVELTRLHRVFRIFESAPLALAEARR